MSVLTRSAKSPLFHPSVEANLFTPTQIASRVKELAQEITKRHAHSKELTVIGILKGSFMFISDLVRQIKLPLQLDFLSVSSYVGQHSSGMVRLNYDIHNHIKKRDVILVDDIVDTGFSLAFARKHLLAKGPKSLEVCVLLDKPERRKVHVPVRYVGFTVPDRFVVGYGLDYNERFRELPYIGILKQMNLEV